LSTRIRPLNILKRKFFTIGAPLFLVLTSGGSVRHYMGTTPGYVESATFIRYGYRGLHGYRRQGSLPFLLPVVFFETYRL
jgi:hypothetical protein